MTGQVLNDLEKNKFETFIQIIGVFEPKAMKDLVIILSAGVVRENVINLRGHLINLRMNVKLECSLLVWSHFVSRLFRKYVTIYLSPYQQYFICLPCVILILLFVILHIFLRLVRSFMFM